VRVPQTPPPVKALLAGMDKPERMVAILGAVAGTEHDGRYFHWDELRFRSPPKDLSHGEWWLGLKLNRQMIRRPVPLLDKSGAPFHYVVPDSVTDLLHQIDRGSGTLVDVPEAVTSQEQRDRYVVRSLMEEAITSSQLEGAATTREVAKKMLAEGRAPRDTSEKMILNNYLTMQRVRELKSEPLTPQMIFHLHRLVSDGTLEKPDAAGRLRRDNEPVDVSNEFTGQVFHVPPPAGQLADRLGAMCEFANGRTPEHFIHPVVRAIILHFWLAYDHPFVDGNGRTARALFYWHMLHTGYWLFEFVSISQFLRKAPAQYGTAFLHTETDENDLTYFVLHQADIIRRALRELHDYVARKARETRVSLDLLHRHPALNHRQQALLAHALKHPGFAYSIRGHGSRHAVVYQTARTDLLGLADTGLLEQRKAGRALAFFAPRDLEKRLQTQST
jgi:Fic family protein